MNLETHHRHPRRAVLLGAFLLFASAALPTAAAHNCTAEAGSSHEDACAGVCKDGEDHEHRVTHHHENGPREDESHVHYEYTSTASEPPCATPRVLGFCVLDHKLQAWAPAWRGALTLLTNGAGAVADHGGGEAA